MRVTIAVVGRLGRGKGAGARALFDDYAKRLSFPLALEGCEEKRPLPPEERRRREGELLFKLVPKGALVVALDRRGKAFSSADFARLLGSWRNRGLKDVCFLVGGADGLDELVRARAALILSLGAMTWPHLLVPVLLAEQLFRAESILAGHPYHRE
ncbi:MAG: 23S rRNA (pseudouridine(1915)-N(3))-methyltransferase RlmH [Rhodospirillales bacterium]|nr:23S rRNA (pseudouridine(1915)-N(3))-methyltransferase RlmH [Rhodospirillales bacterium]MSP80841.1 23S rRNA (pseudouridine(1915)-N(3))-methyltransferase RlmH [Rhodospirillales bacterium]